ncbi:MAG: glycosyltransferase [Candidatus Cloacimonas sp.]|nr:glycosyltransferase [Candidatus Cloacimonadota bacterium]
MTKEFKDNKNTATKEGRLKEVLPCSIGIFIHNEVQNIGKLLDALLNQNLRIARIEEIIVVSSASTDGSDELVTEYSEKNPIIKLIQESERRGKSAAINTFIELAQKDIAVIISGDVIPAENTIERLVAPYLDEKVGMVGCHPVPTDKENNFVGYWVNVQWRLHHKIALQSPKMGEMVSFRKVMDGIPPESAVDEASIEAIIRAKGLELKYAPDAIVYNKGADTIKDFMKQRRRIAAGHLWLKKTETYNVSTNNPSFLLKPLLTEMVTHPLKIHYMVAIILLEAWSRYLGWYDLVIKKKNPFKWDISTSTKKVDI